MRINKAIEIQSIYLTHPYIKGEHDLKEAIKLSIEALKRIIEFRQTGTFPAGYPLPGETQEGG